MRYSNKEARQRDGAYDGKQSGVSERDGTHLSLLSANTTDAAEINTDATNATITFIISRANTNSTKITKITITNTATGISTYSDIDTIKIITIHVGNDNIAIGNNTNTNTTTVNNHSTTTTCITTTAATAAAAANKSDSRYDIYYCTHGTDGQTQD